MSNNASIENTVRKVADEALEEMKKDLETGTGSASEVIARRMNESMSEVQRIAEQEERQADALRRQIIGAAEMSARNKSLEIVEENMNEAFSQSMTSLRAATSGADYQRVLKGMVGEAIDQIGGDSFSVQCTPKDRDAVNRVIQQLSSEKNVNLNIDSDAPLSDSIGGVVVKSSDGFVTFDNTFEARIERLKPALRKQIAQLFAENR
jgi:V/A-type H+/Na+-transporting ATPase subunit E